MKQNFLKTGALFSLIILTFSSCFKNDLEEPVIPDPPSWSHSAIWVETERKRGTADWETLPSSNRLSLWWNYTDSSKKNMVGAYKYKPTNLGISIDTAGYMQVKNALLSLIAIKAGGIKDTTATVEYLNYGDTALVIRNTAVVSITEIRYRKIK